MLKTLKRTGAVIIVLTGIGIMAGMAGMAAGIHYDSLLETSLSVWVGALGFVAILCGAVYLFGRSLEVIGDMLPEQK